MMTTNSNSAQVGGVNAAVATRERWDAREAVISGNTLQYYGDTEASFAQDSGSFDFVSDLVHVTWLRIRLISIVMLICALLAFIYAFNLENVFESSAEINLLPQAPLPVTSEGSHERPPGSDLCDGANAISRLPATHREFCRHITT